MFAMCEDGSRRFVCTFLQRLRPSGALDSALHAARFVRLLPYRPAYDLGGERSQVWHRTHTFLCKRFGDVEDHCLLLCSLLLGFGLDAYVCIGRKRSGVHMWVMTRDGRHGNRTGGAVFWESLTGQRYAVNPDMIDDETVRALPYTSVGCIFNDRAFYANVQAIDTVCDTRWSLDDESLWKRMREQSIATLQRQCGRGHAVPLLPNTLDGAAEAIALEAELRALIEQHRLQQLQTSVNATRWDHELAYILTPALSAYEAQVCTGISYGNDLFQQSIKHHVPLNFAFKVFRWSKNT